MKTLIIYNSIHHGNTAKIAKAIAKPLKAKLVKVNKANKKMISKYDLIGFGSGIYFGKHDKNLLKFIDTLTKDKKNGNKKKKCFIFATSGLRNWGIFNNFNCKIKKKLKKKNFEVIGEFSCRGFETFGPFKLFGGKNKGRPNKKDMKTAKTFAQKLKIRCK